MSELSGYTLTELLKMGQDVVKKHDDLKSETLNLINKVKEIEKEINDNIENIYIYEKLYVDIIKEIDNKK